MINEALRLLRVFNDLKSGELAIRLGISPSYLSEIENGKKEPSLDIIKKYSTVFNITPSSIMFFAEQLDTDEERVKGMISKRLLGFLNNVEKHGKD